MDANGCKTDTIDDDDGHIAITQPESPISLSIVLEEDITCWGDDDGIIAYTVEGGNGDYTTAIITGFSVGDTLDDSGLDSSGFEDLEPDSYWIITSDPEGCADTSAMITISEPDSMHISDITVIPNVCAGDDEATVLFTATGGIDFGAGNYDACLSALTLKGVGCLYSDNATNFLDEIEGGSYWLTLTDDNGCTVQDSVHVIDPPGMSLDVTNDAVACFGDTVGNIHADATGGTGDYTYYLIEDGPGDDTLSVLTLPNGTDTAWYDVLLGDYMVVLKDTSGCENVEYVTLGAPSPLKWNASQMATSAVDDAQCNGAPDGRISLYAQGGTPWTVGVSYRFSIAGGTFKTNNSSGYTLAAGSYSAIVKDSNGCEIDLL
jgi:hypothetical protein